MLAPKTPSPIDQVPLRPIAPGPDPSPYLLRLTGRYPAGSPAKWSRLYHPALCCVQRLKLRWFGGGSYFRAIISRIVGCGLFTLAHRWNSATILEPGGPDYRSRAKGRRQFSKACEIKSLTIAQVRASEGAEPSL